MYTTFLKHLAEVSAHPLSLFTLLGVLLLIFLFLYVRHIQLTTNMLVYVALMLALTILAYAPTSPGTILIEEPENGIHPQAVETVIQSLQSVYGSQVFLATHSPLVLSLIKSDQLLCFGKAASGAVDVVRGTEHPQLRQWKAALHLGDLLALGVLG